MTGWGTGGTLTGAGQILERARPDLKVVAYEPAGAQLLADQPFKPHKFQGWTPDFVPAVLDRTIFDERLAISEDVAVTGVRELARKEASSRDLGRRHVRWCTARRSHLGTRRARHATRHR